MSGVSDATDEELQKAKYVLENDDVSRSIETPSFVTVEDGIVRVNQVETEEAGDEFPAQDTQHTIGPRRWEDSIENVRDEIRKRGI